ncbi:LytR/AlgR family response regulator transcription factor [Spirosoma fluviale]|uniref:Two component transcriptional regulator, LytTR family n=1 Tax=Spirosoma fluviale TaxID=1597977 RepID=A0A286FB81_9BACT|nr:LytTR family DNA-binding domain-containing protein [Spirosoma fluviale]SOD80104.1 two component transcriptional regulator, LytTR family [Spirosoma fluviale]
MNSYQTPSILIIEDNLVDASWLNEVLVIMGFKSPFVAHDIDSAANIIVNQRPHLMICDLFFNGRPDGLTLLNQFSALSKQFIMTTNSYETGHYEQTRAIGVGGHLIKPFHPLTLRSVIDQLLSPSPTPPPTSSHLFIRGAQNKQIRVHLDEILFLYSERNYTFIKTVQGRFTIKRSLNKMQEDLDKRFLRIHNSYIVNVDFLKSISINTVLIDKDIIPLGRAYRKNLTPLLNSNREEKAN